MPDTGGYVKIRRIAKYMNIKEIETIVHRDENRVMEAKETTGELVKGMQSGCAFLNTDGGWPETTTF